MTNDEYKWKNARVAGTFLGIEDHGIFTAQLNLEWRGGGVWWGGLSLDTYDEVLKHRVDCFGLVGELVRGVMRICEVDSWEKVVGKYVQFQDAGTGRAIGPVLRGVTNDEELDPMTLIDLLVSPTRKLHP